MLPLTGRRALICGASQGIGAATARQLSQQGAQIVLLARSEDKLKGVQSSLSGSGHSLIAVDMTHPAHLIGQVTKELEKGPIEILVNNSGGPKAGPLVEALDTEFSQGFQSHVIASQLLVQLLFPGMRQRSFGRIVNVMSTSVKAPIPNLGVSNTIRAAMANWAKTLSVELGPYGITVNNVLPGYTATERLETLAKATAERQGVPVEQVKKTWRESTPLKRFAEPQEIAYAIAFLVSNQAGFITGINLPVDGGRLPNL